MEKLERRKGKFACDRFTESWIGPEGRAALDTARLNAVVRELAALHGEGRIDHDVLAGLLAVLYSGYVENEVACKLNGLFERKLHDQLLAGLR